MYAIFRTFCRLKRVKNTLARNLKIFTFLAVVFLAGGCHVFSSLVFMAFPNVLFVSLYEVFLEVEGIRILYSFSDF